MGVATLSVLSIPSCSDHHAKGDTASAISTPFSQSFGFDPFTGSWSDVQREQRVAACMADRGFRYIAKQTSDLPPPFGTGTREGVDRSGYGIALGFFDKAPPDPNDAVVAALTPSEHQAYMFALVGPARKSGESVPTEKLGCIPKTQMEMYGFEGQFPPALQSLVDFFVAGVASDPAVVSATKRWQVCVRALGYEVTDRPAIVHQIEGRRDAILYPGSGAQVGVSDGSFDHAAFRELQTYEHDIALADFDCDQKVGLAVAQGDALSRLETDYSNQHPGFDLRRLSSTGSDG